MIIPQGKVTAIVGDSGSGKTTLLKLILRLYKPTHGELSMGNLNIQNISLKQWRDSCGAVMQDGKIFSDTIQNNNVLDDENINYERLKKAVTVANIATEIEAMPKGYQTMMGEIQDLRVVEDSLRGQFQRRKSRKVKPPGRVQKELSRLRSERIRSFLDAVDRVHAFWKRS